MGTREFAAALFRELPPFARGYIAALNPEAFITLAECHEELLHQEMMSLAEAEAVLALATVPPELYS